MSERPLISVIVPTLNEEGHIARLLDSLASQTYEGPFEVIVADGGSSDRTRQIVLQEFGQYEWIRMIHNPGRTQSRAFNLGLAESRGEVVGYIGAHAELAPDFLEQTVAALEASKAAGVGGRWQIRAACPCGQSKLKRLENEAIVIAMSSPFGPGTADYRWRTKGMETDTVLYGFYRRRPLEEVGGIDPTLKVNEDYELNIRLRKAGYRLFFSPAIRISYYCRSSVTRLWKQYFSYGFWKARVAQLHPSSLRLRHLAAPLLVAGILSGWPLLVAPWPLPGVYLAGVSLYCVVSLACSIVLAHLHGWRYLFLLPLVFGTLHIAWGAGFFTGALRWWVPHLVLLRPGSRKPTR